MDGSDDSPIRLLIRLLYTAYMEVLEKKRTAGDKSKKWPVTPGSTFQDSLELVSHEDSVAPVLLSELGDICDRYIFIIIAACVVLSSFIIL